MKGKLFMSALLRLRNLGGLLLSLGIGYAVLPEAIPAADGSVPGLIALAVYLALVVQTLTSQSFNEQFLQKQKIRSIQDLNYSCQKLANEARKHTNSAYYQKLKRVMEAKEEIVNSFFRGEKNPLKEKVVEQSLNLVIAYVKLLSNFCIRSRELSGVDISEITERINMNSRKLSFAKDPYAAEDIQKIIDMDQKIIERLKEEKNDLERINAKLDYMESTVNMFKHQILSSIESEDMLEKMETVVNEAAALDSVLYERRKNKMRM